LLNWATAFAFLIFIVLLNTIVSKQFKLIN
jgi:hypothetical protein